MKLRFETSDVLNPNAIIASANMAAQGLKGPRHRTCTDALQGRVQFGSLLDDVFEAESALAGEPLAFAPAAQVLSVGPLGVNVALRYCTGTTCFVACLERKDGHGLVVTHWPF